MDGKDGTIGSDSACAHTMFHVALYWHVAWHVSKVLGDVFGNKILRLAWHTRSRDAPRCRSDSSLSSFYDVQVVYPTAGVHPYHVEGCGPIEDAMVSIATLAANEQGTKEEFLFPGISFKRGTPWNLHPSPNPNPNPIKAVI